MSSEHSPKLRALKGTVNSAQPKIFWNNPAMIHQLSEIPSDSPGEHFTGTRGKCSNSVGREMPLV